VGSYVSVVARSGGAAAAQAACQKSAKYDSLGTDMFQLCLFQPIVVETFGPLNKSPDLTQRHMD